MDSNEYIKVLRELVEEGREVSLVISGHSMTPFLVEKRDKIYFKKLDRKLKKGDMVFYQRSTGQYVMHRIGRITFEGYYMVGDAQTNIEGPILKEQIFGLVVKAERKGKLIGPGNFWWEFFEHVWIHMISLRPIFTRLYNLIRKV